MWISKDQVQRAKDKLENANLLSVLSITLSVIAFIAVGSLAKEVDTMKGKD